MNIMLVSVTERTREIGVRMAVGARRADIVAQFLTEAVLVCLLGGLLGVALALGAGALLAQLQIDLRLVYSTPTIVLAFLSSTLIGIVFGFLPARSAAFARDHLAPLGRDQALLNGVLRGDWAEMSPLWNWQFTWASSHLLGMADPFVVHFIGPLKPWLAEAAGAVPTRYRSLYDRLPGDIRPADLPAGLGRRHWPTPRALHRALWRQWRAAGPMLAYLGRFADPCDLLDPSRAV